MTNQPSLNPDALESAFYAVEHPAVTRDDMEDIVSDAVRAYLAVAQPEVQANSKPNQNFEVVNSVEELEALPDGSIVKDSEGEVYIMTPYDEFWRVWGNDKRFASGAIVLPALVLHRPDRIIETVLKRAPETPRR